MDATTLSNTGGNTGSYTGPTFGNTGNTAPKIANTGTLNKTSLTKTPIADHLKGNASDFTTGVLSAAMDGKMGNLFKTAFPHPETLHEDFKKMTGMDLRDFARQLETGSPAAAMAGLSNMPPAASKMEASLEKYLDQNKGSGSSYAGGGGGGTKAAAKPKAATLSWGAFGAKPAGGTTTESNFAAVKKLSPGGPESNDIWHEGFGGSIFQIVSLKLEKLVKNQEKIENLEWDTALNRALVGLPSRSQKAGGK